VITRSRCIDDQCKVGRCTERAANFARAFAKNAAACCWLHCKSLAGEHARHLRNGIAEWKRSARDGGKVGFHWRPLAEKNRRR